MTHVSAGQLHDDLDTTIRRIANDHERIILRRNGKNRVALVPMKDLALLEAIEDREDLEDVRAIREEIKREGTVPWETVKKDLGL